MAVLVVGVFTMTFAKPSCAQSVTLDDLLKRVEAVEKQNAELQQQNADLRSEIEAIKNNQAQAAQSSRPAAPAASASLAPAPVPGLNFVTSKLKLNVYGYVQLENVYSTGSAVSASSGSTTAVYSNVVSYAAPHGMIGKAQKNDTFSAQNSRLGMSITGPDVIGGKTSGKVEVDFNNPTASSSAETYQPRLRLAFASLDYEKWGVTAGQNWDFFAPLKTDIINSSNMWRAGDFGYRHPQVFLTARWGEVLGGKLTTQVGLIDSSDIYQDNSGAPVAGIYASYATKIAGHDTTIGAGGIFGTTSTSTLNSIGKDNNNMYAEDVNAQISITRWLSLKGQGFMGGNLANFMGGPYGQSIPGITDTILPQNSKPLKTLGGFAEFTIKPVKKLQFNLGAGLDDTTNRSSVIASPADQALMWSTNRSYFANVKYNLTNDLTVGIEYQYLHTNYLDGVIGSDNRIDTCMTYNF